MHLTILATSSSVGSYEVDFSDDAGALKVFCHCQAGTFQQICKHKLGLLRGDRTMMYDASQEELLRRVLASPAYPEMKRRLLEYEKQLSVIEDEMDKLKAREKALKIDFAHELSNGPRGLHG